MRDFIQARSTFYPITAEGEHRFFCSDNVDTFSFLKQDFTARVMVDHLTIAHQETDENVEQKSREWINQAARIRESQSPFDRIISSIEGMFGESA